MLASAESILQLLDNLERGAAYLQAARASAYTGAMELRQLRYCVQVVESGSLTWAAAALGVVTSAISQQISRLEGELATLLLQRGPAGVRPTDAGGTSAQPPRQPV